MTRCTSRILPGMARDEKMTRRRRDELYRRMFASAARAIAARDSPWLPVAITTTRSRGRGRKVIERKETRNAFEIAAVARNLDRAIERAARDHDAAAAGLRRLGDARPRAMFEANVVTSTRPVASLTNVRNVRATSLSEKLSPSRRMLVESQISAVTPSSPIARNRASSIRWPTPGSDRSFQSPVCRARPAGDADGQRASLRNRGATAIIHAERRKIEHRSRPHAGDLDIWPPGSERRRVSMSQRRKASRKRGNAASAIVSQRADMVLMRVRYQKAEGDRGRSSPRRRRRGAQDRLPEDPAPEM